MAAEGVNAGSISVLIEKINYNVVDTDGCFGIPWTIAIALARHALLQAPRVNCRHKILCSTYDDSIESTHTCMIYVHYLDINFIDMYENQNHSSASRPMDKNVAAGENPLRQVLLQLTAFLSGLYNMTTNSFGGACYISLRQIFH